MIINGLPVIILAIYILHARCLPRQLNEEVRRSNSWRQDTMEINAKLYEARAELKKLERARKQADITSNGTEEVA